MVIVSARAPVPLLARITPSAGLIALQRRGMVWSCCENMTGVVERCEQDRTKEDEGSFSGVAVPIEENGHAGAGWTAYQWYVPATTK